MGKRCNSRLGPDLSRRTLLRAAGAIVVVPAGMAEAQQTPLVSAASDLQFALREVVAAYRSETGRDVRLTFGASGNIARQIKAGAPYDVFLSADESFVRDLEQAGLTKGDSRLYAIGRLMLMVPHTSRLAPDPSLEDLRRALIDGRLQKLAIANPEHAPYGRAAREVLQHVDLWQTLQHRMVLGENVAQAAQFAASGAAQGALIAHALALGPQLASQARYALIDGGWHAPLRQHMVMTHKATETAEHFFGYLQGAAARAILAHSGFALPER